MSSNSEELKQIYAYVTRVGNFDDYVNNIVYNQLRTAQVERDLLYSGFQQIISGTHPNITTASWNETLSLAYRTTISGDIDRLVTFNTTISGWQNKWQINMDTI